MNISTHLRNFDGSFSKNFLDKKSDCITIETRIVSLSPSLSKDKKHG